MKPLRKFSWIPVIVSRGDERQEFYSMNKAAQFLAEREHYSLGGVLWHLCKRREEVYGWRIKYLR